jgi:hypothetical protein
MLDYINPRVIATYDFLRSNRARFAACCSPPAAMAALALHH